MGFLELLWCSADELGSSKELCVFPLLASGSIGTKASLKVLSVIAAIDLLHTGAEVANARSTSSHEVLNSIFVLVAGCFGAKAAANHAKEIEL